MRPSRRVLTVVVGTLVWMLLATPTASAQTPVLYGGVDDTTIWLRVGSHLGPLARNLAPGTYTLRISDTARNHNFRLNVPGRDIATDVAEVYSGYREWTVTLPDGAYVYNCDAHPGLNGSFTVGDVLSVQRVGPGSGDVASEPAGIACGGLCTSPFPAGTQVVLTAVAAPGSRFRGWSGACSGTGTCSVTVQGGTVVSAGFDSVAPPPAPPPPVSLTGTSVATANGRRIVVATLRVREHAAVLARLLRGRTTVASAERHLMPGLRKIRIAVPRRAAAGRHVLRVRVTAGTRSFVLTRHVTLPR